eukprot:scaffold5516_cov127-Skeletonema_menzelii.AAC.3
MSKWKGNATQFFAGGDLESKSTTAERFGLGSNIKRRAGGVSPDGTNSEFSFRSIEIQATSLQPLCTMSMSEPSSRARSIPSMTPFPAVLAETVSSQTLEALNDDILFSLSYAL